MNPNDNLERWTKRRADYLENHTALERIDAELIAFSELGFSASGIAKHIDLVESTVRRHLEEIADLYGEQAVWARKTDDLGIDEPIE